MAKPRDIHEAARAARHETQNTDAKRGKVVSISRDYEDPSKVRVEIELPPVPRKKGTGPVAVGESPGVYKPRETVTVDEDFARELAIGDQISVTTTTAIGVATAEVPEAEPGGTTPIKPVQVMPRFRGR